MHRVKEREGEKTRRKRERERNDAKVYPTLFLPPSIKMARRSEIK